ncbi:MAG: leucine-rich repeat domain-containing protein, partial [Lentisphaeraceae bacterium]|nr:leucine-rich repeat domain-containing protein [Lentisphaeraceae bacterium]
FRHEVQDYLRGFATGAEGAGFLKQLKLFYKRNGLYCQIILSSLTLISLLIAVSISQLSNKEQAAEQARKIAEAEKIKATENLRAYERQSRVNKQMQREVNQTLQALKQRYLSKAVYEGSFEDILVKFSKSADNQVQFNAVMALLDTVLKDDPYNKKAWLEKAYLHFVMQQFKQCRQAYQRAENQNKELLKLAQKYSSVKIDDELLSSAQLKRLFKSINNRRRLQVLILCYDGQMNSSITSHAVNVKTLTELMNRACRNLNFQFSGSGLDNKLSLAGSLGLKRLNAKFRGDPYNSILQYLKLSVLDISGTDIVDCREITGLNLIELNISETKITDIRPLQKMTKLKKLIINSGVELRGLEELKKRGVVIESR